MSQKQKCRYKQGQNTASNLTKHKKVKLTSINRLLNINTKLVIKSLLHSKKKKLKKNGICDFVISLVINFLNLMTTRPGHI